MSRKNDRIYIGEPLLSGKHFRLMTDTLGVSSREDQRELVTVPAGSVVKIMSGPRPDSKGMVVATWNGLTLEMFADDIRTRGEEITSRQAGA